MDLQNVQIQEKFQKKKFGIKHSLEYISSLWRKKIPKLIASTAEDQWLDWNIIYPKKKVNIKMQSLWSNQTQLIINILVKIKQVKMDFIVYVKIAVIRKKDIKIK